MKCSTPYRHTLLSQMVVGHEDIDILKIPDIHTYIEATVNVCGGLQLALCIAGRTLGTILQELGDIRKGFHLYVSLLEQDIEAARDALLYHYNLSYIVQQVEKRKSNPTSREN